jgi:tetratricopeptide (TPR) repeat protein
MINDEPGDISSEAFRKGLVCLLLLGLIVRLGFLVEHARSPSFGVLTMDQKYYDTSARMLLTGQDLHQLRALRPLLYPMFVAALYKLSGPRGIDLTVALQHLLGIFTGLLVALLGARLFRHRLSGLAGGVLYLLAPVPLYFEGELLVESSYVFLICLGLVLLLRAATASGRKAGLLWLLCGALTVLTAQERPNILVLMAVYPLLAAWQLWRSRRAATLRPLLGLIGAAAMAIPWGFVNKMQSDHFMLIPSEGGVNLYLGNQRGSDGIKVALDRYVNYREGYEEPAEVWAREEYAAAMRAQGRQPDLNPMAVSHYWTQRTLGEIEAAPAAWLQLMVKKSWLMLWNTEVPHLKSFAFLQINFLWLRVLPVRWCLLLMLAPAGIWAAAKPGNRDALFILLVYACLYFAADLAFFVSDRFRYPLWPVMAAFAGGGLLAFIETLRHYRWRAALCLAAGMALVAALSLPNWYGVKLPSFAIDYRLRSIAWYEKGHFQEALSDIDRSIALDPSDMASQQHRGNVLLALNRFDDARQQYERTFKFTLEDASLWNNYAVALEGLGRTNEALEAFRRATQCQPPSRSAFLGLAFEQVRSGRLDDAAATLDGLAKVQPGPNAVVLAIRSVLAREHGDVAQAGALERQARALDPAAAAWAIERAGNKGERK